MGHLDDLCQARFGDLYGGLLHLGSRSREVFELLANCPSSLEDLGELLKAGWRENLVGAVAALFHPDRPAALLWEAFDRGSWVSPQLAVCALALDPGDLAEAKKRLLLRCPSRTEHLVPLDPMQRHVEHGSASISSFNMKGMGALLATVARHEAGRAWLSGHLPLEDAFWALEVDTWDHGDELARDWGDRARQILEELGRPLPAWLQGDVPADLLGLWEHPPAVRALCRGPWRARIYRLFHEVFARGKRSLLIDEKGRLLAREVSGNQVLLDLPTPFLQGVWEQLIQSQNAEGIYDLREYGHEPPAIKLLEGQAARERRVSGLQLSLLESYQSEPSFQIVPHRLEQCPATLWILGIDAQARLDGGVSAAVAATAGEGYAESLREGLAQSGRQPGAVVLTRGFAAPRVRVIAHIVTVPRPSVQELARGLQIVLDHARAEGIPRLALPALGCGAAGYAAADVAGPLMEVLARYAEHFEMVVCAPREADRVAFERAARSQGLT